MSLREHLDSLASVASAAIAQATSSDAVRDLEIKYLGRKGELTELLRSLKDLPIDERKAIGDQANKLRESLNAKISSKIESFEATRIVERIDPTLPPTEAQLGVTHLINQVMGEICEVFYGMGFKTEYGPHIETDYYNFEALNFPPDHPARDMQDTFFVEGGRLLRTHTTPVQPRVLEKGNLPCKVITPGRTFRNEAISTRAHVSFHQVDGFLVDEGVSMADLRGCLQTFCRTFFGKNLRFRFQPSFFPFTEPSADIYISCFLCDGKGCQLCKQAGWLEVLGCGMIHPNVLEKANIDTEKYTGFAFGIGVERIAMLRHRIPDIRLFFASNVRFLKQFR